MKIQDVRIGERVWYLYLSLATGMTHQTPAVVLELRGDRVRIRKEGSERPTWVKAKNLRPTN